MGRRGPTFRQEFPTSGSFGQPVKPASRSTYIQYKYKQTDTIHPKQKQKQTHSTFARVSPLTREYGQPVKPVSRDTQSAILLNFVLIVRLMTANLYETSLHVWKSSMPWAITVILFCLQLTTYNYKTSNKNNFIFVSLLYLVGREHLDFFLMNDPQSFLRGKLIHGPGAWLMSPSPLRQWVTPTILHPVSTLGASLLAMRIVQPVCEASRCCPR